MGGEGRRPLKSHTPSFLKKEKYGALISKSRFKDQMQH